VSKIKQRLCRIRPGQLSTKNGLAQSLEALQDFFPEFQNQRFNFLWLPILVSSFRLCDVPVENRLD
jgi:hypothetical protein